MSKARLVAVSLGNGVAKTRILTSISVQVSANSQIGLYLSLEQVDMDSCCRRWRPAVDVKGIRDCSCWGRHRIRDFQVARLRRGKKRMSALPTLALSVDKGLEAKDTSAAEPSLAT